MNEWLRAALLEVVWRYLKEDGLKPVGPAGEFERTERDYEWTVTVVVEKSAAPSPFSPGWCDYEWTVTVVVEKDKELTRYAPLEERYRACLTVLILPEGNIAIIRCERLPETDPNAPDVFGLSQNDIREEHERLALEDAARRVREVNDQAETEQQARLYIEMLEPSERTKRAEPEVVAAIVDLTGWEPCRAEVFLRGELHRQQLAEEAEFKASVFRERLRSPETGKPKPGTPEWSAWKGERIKNGLAAKAGKPH